MMASQGTNTTAATSPLTLAPPLATSSDAAGNALGTKLQAGNALVASVPFQKTPARKPGLLLSANAVDWVLKDFVDSIGPQDALLNALAAGRM